MVWYVWTCGVVWACGVVCLDMWCGMLCGLVMCIDVANVKNKNKERERTRYFQK